MSHPKFQHRYLLLLLLLLPLLPAPSALAASACKVGEKATIDGIVKTTVLNNAYTHMWLFIESPAWDCGPIYIYAPVKHAETCPLGSKIHATGTLAAHDPANPQTGWSLVDKTPGADAGRNDLFSCRDAPPVNPGLIPKHKTK